MAKAPSAKRTQRASTSDAKKTPPSLGDLLETAAELAVRYHRGQRDKYDQPYILHIFGVMGRCRTVEEKIVALLHDLVEDGHISLTALVRKGFPPRITHAVDLLTRRKGEPYDAFVDRIAPDPRARAVKLADLEDNMDFRRSDRPMKEKDGERMEKYRRAWQHLSTLHVAE